MPRQKLKVSRRFFALGKSTPYENLFIPLETVKETIKPAAVTHTPTVTPTTEVSAIVSQASDDTVLHAIESDASKVKV